MCFGMASVDPLGPSRSKQGNEGARRVLIAIVVSGLLQDVSGVSNLLRATAAQELDSHIINGSVVSNTSVYHSFFALPTRGPDTDAWLGCGASIISPTFALSSAHCFGGGQSPCSGPKRLAVWVGHVKLETSMGMTQVVPIAGTRSFRVKAEVVCHPGWDGKCSHGNDMALLKLHGRLPKWVRPIPLDLHSNSAIGDTLVTIGYGLTESPYNRDEISTSTSDVLRRADVTTLLDNSQNCARVFAGGYGCSDSDSEAPGTNIGTQLCAGSAAFKDTCSGDSGSPVLNAKGRQVGIVSYGGGPGEKLSGPGRMCGDPTYPGFYARLSGMKHFVLSRVADLPS
eukprot:TRINITY_DN63977_c0_g1_i1.p1 TRINITY_DN63977_c0_g1~~TRINITY_DN63977_c0_g1_i1.p1  ORF type:complete len:340 (-),score=30.53 TRINITY_DN63977_c0_g1_i1:205-1224(-)